MVSLEGDTTEMTGFKTSEGRLPETPDEIVLPKSSRAPTFSGAARSSSGRRRPSSSDSASRTFATAPTPRKTPRALSAPTSPTTRCTAEASIRRSSPTATCSTPVTHTAPPTREGAAFFETIENATPRTYTVVGFYESHLLTWTPNGCLAFTGADPSAAGPTRLYVSTSAFDSMADMEDHLKSTLGDTFLDYHSTLLRYAGVTDDRAAWSTLYRSRRSSRR